MKLQIGVTKALLLSTQILTATAALSLASISAKASELVDRKAAAGVAAAAAADNLPSEIEQKMGAVKSPYKACAGVVIVERPADTSKWKKEEAFWSKYPAEGCDATKIDCTRKVQFIPETHFYKAFDGRLGPNFSGTVSADDFLKRVADRSIAKVKANITKYEAQQKCFANPTGDCAAKNKARLEALRAVAPKFRLIVGRLAEQSKDYMGNDALVPKSASDFVTSDLKKVETQLIMPKGMDPLNNTEFDTIKKEFDALLAKSAKDRDADIEKIIKEKNIAPQDVEKTRAMYRDAKSYAPRLREELEAKRKENVEAYAALLKEFPELAYADLRHMTDADMAKKMSEMIADSKETMNDMVGANATRTVMPGAFNKKRLVFAAHSETIETMLKEEGDGKSCAAANAVYNELASVRTKDGLVIGGITVAASLGAGVAGMFKGKAAGAATAAGLTSEAGMLTAQATWLGRLAIATGAGGGMTNTAIELGHTDEQVRGAKVGTVKVEEGREALAGKTLQTAIGVLDFQGTGTLVGAAAGVAGYGLARMGLATVLKNGAAAGSGGAKATATQLAERIVAARAGDKSAAEAVKKAGLEGEKALLGRVPSDVERKALEVADKQKIFGTAEKPNTEAIQAFATETKSLTAQQRDTYAKEYSELVGGLKSDLGSPERVAVVGRAAAEVVGSGVDTKAATAILNEWPPDAVTGWAMVVKKMKDFKGSAEQKFKAAWESVATKAKLAKSEIAKWRDKCGCAGACPIAVGANASPWEQGEASYMACVAR